jgi:hypothetical protein
MNWQVVSIILTAFIFLVNIGITLYILLSNRATKKDDEKQSKGDLLWMKTLEGVENKIMGEIKLLLQGQNNINEDLKESKLELKDRQKEAREKADRINEMNSTLKEVLSELQKLKDVPSRLTHLEREQEKIMKMYIELINERA